ncbi:MAG: VWA domain-containing protein [Pyrinomonadaceae bacterium]
MSALAFVFDRLKPESRGIVRRAATSYVSNGGNVADIVGVFAVDQSLRIVQPFTNDKALIQQGVDRASSLNSSTYYLSSELNRVQSRGSYAPAAFGGQIGLDREGPVAAAAASGPGNESAIAAAIMAGMTTRSLEIFERLERDQQGYATTGGMLAVIESLRQIPGRKAVVLFSDGLAIPSAVEAQFQSLISTANRANVSIYAVDAAGLRAESGAAEVSSSTSGVEQEVSCSRQQLR